MDSSTSVTSKPRRSTPHPTHQKLCISICSALLLFLLLLLLLLILALTVFKPRNAVTTVRSLSLDSINLSLDLLNLSVHFNISLAVDLSVRNPNRASFRYANSSALLYYRRVLVGEVPVPAGSIGAGETVGMNLTLVVMADQLLSDSRLYSDVVAGTLPLNTTTRFSGRVSVLKLFKRHVVTSSFCDVMINVRNRTVERSNCVYKTKF